ncbi:MAG: O-antigen ligase family protein [Defluviitaleaceae bacterium]|nr:O-antigen ligase family protein [Defluviitaleaceae bacterium]
MGNKTNHSPAGRQAAKSSPAVKSSSAPLSKPKQAAQMKRAAIRKLNFQAAAGFRDFSQADWVFGVVLFLTAAVVPLIVRYAARPVGPDQASLYYNMTTTNDMFSYYKSILILCAAVIIIVYAVYRMVVLRLWKTQQQTRRGYFNPIYIAIMVLGFLLTIVGNIAFPQYQYITAAYWCIAFIVYILVTVISNARNIKIGKKNKSDHTFFMKPLYIAVGVFALFALLSWFLSPYKYTVIHGISERFESVFVLLGYFVLFFAATAFAKSLFKVKFILWGVLISGFVIGMIGFFQFMGLNPFETKFFQWLVLGSASATKHLTFVYNQVYSTLFNPNCVGAYTSLLVPLMVMGAIYAGKDLRIRVAFIADAALLFFCWIGCDSAGGFMGMAMAVLAVIVIFVVLLASKKIKITPKPGIMAAAAGIVVVGVLVCALVPAVRNGIAKTATKVFDMSSTQSTNFFNGLSFNDATATISTQNGAVSVTYDTASGKFTAAGPDGKTAAPGSSSTSAPSGADQSTWTTDSYSISGFGSFQIQSQGSFAAFLMNGVSFRFAVDNNDKLDPVSSSMKLLSPDDTVRTLGFSGMELWGSGRGYIWSRTIPLMLDHPVIGSGPDTFALVFPQDDVIGKAEFMGNPYIIVDKAHNMFMQTAVNTGGISMLALLFIFGYFIVTALRAILRAKKEDIKVWGLQIGILAGVVGYAVASLSTDSTVSVSPVFWIVLGVGFAMNRLIGGSKEK